MNPSRIALEKALAIAGYTLDDVREWNEHAPGLWHILIHTHRVVWYRIDTTGRMSPL